MSSPTYSQGPASLWRLQVDPAQTSGVLSSCVVQAFYQSTFTNDSDPTDAFTKPAGSVNIDCIAKGATTVTFTFMGQSYTMPYGLIVTAAGAAADQEWHNAQG